MSELQTVISRQLSRLTGEEVTITDLEAIYFASVLWEDRAPQLSGLITPDSRV